VSTGIRLDNKYWNEDENKVRKTHPNSVRLNRNFQKLLAKCMDRALTVESDFVDHLNLVLAYTSIVYSGLLAIVFDDTIKNIHPFLVVLGKVLYL
jgi:hypothetical protein